MVDRQTYEIESKGPANLSYMSTQIWVIRGSFGVVADTGEALGDSVDSFVASDVGVSSDPMQFNFNQGGE